MDITIIAVLTAAVLGVIGWLIKSHLDTLKDRTTSNEDNINNLKTKQAQDDTRWDQQHSINVKVESNREDTAVLKSQFVQVDKSIDDLNKTMKSNHKELSGKIDRLLEK